MDNFNQLTPAEAERLAMLAEECGEVIQMIGKILRHGLDSYHPSDPAVSNRLLLTRELVDLEAVVRAMVRHGEIYDPQGQNTSAAWERKLRYAHHQEKLK